MWPTTTSAYSSRVSVVRDGPAGVGSSQLGTRGLLWGLPRYVILHRQQQRREYIHIVIR